MNKRAIYNLVGLGGTTAVWNVGLPIPGNLFAKVAPKARNGSLWSDKLLATIIFCAVLLQGSNLFAQRILHDSKRDKTAQDAESAAKEITSGNIFDKMLNNADLQAKQDIQTQMDFVRQEMKAKLQAFKYWNNNDDRPDEVRRLPNGSPVFFAGFCKSGVCELRSIKARIEAYLDEPSELKPEQVQQRLDQLEAKKKRLDDQLKALQDANKVKDPFVDQAFTLLKDHGKDAIEYAKKLLQLTQNQDVQVHGGLNALDKLSDGLDQTLSLYKAISGIWQGYNAVNRSPASLGPSKQQIDLQLLALEQDHIKMVARINARKSLELGTALTRVNTALNDLNRAQVLNSYSSVEETLNEALGCRDHDRLLQLLYALHEAAAAIAEEDSAGRLAELRLTAEERRYSIRKSAVNSSTYDLTIQAAAQRLALYWKGGIKPEELAQWAFYVANTAGVAAVAGK